MFKVRAPAWYINLSRRHGQEKKMQNKRKRRYELWNNSRWLCYSKTKVSKQRRQWQLTKATCPINLLRDQGLTKSHLNTVLQSCNMYALPAWRGLLTVEQVAEDIFTHFSSGLLNAAFVLHWFLRIWKMVLMKHCFKVLCEVNGTTCTKSSQIMKTSSFHLRLKGHSYKLPRCSLELHKRTTSREVYLDFVLSFIHLS